jgi:hypothetical protein
MYLDYELEQSAPDVDSINITCVLKIKTLVDSRKISPYEYENVTVSLKYYNNPLGSLDSNIQAEIDSIKNSFLVKQSWIGKISKLMQIGGALCGLVGNLIKLNTVLSAIADALGFTPWTKPLSLSMGQISSSLNDFTAGYWGYVNTFCKFLNCQLFYGEAWSTESTSTLASISRWGLKYGEDLWDVKNSLIMSIVFLCLPGVLYNLQKARAIDCQYAKCLKSTAVGMPLQFCVKQRDYGWCSYVWGQVFNLLPLNTLFQITKLIKQALQNPAQFILIILKYFCRAPCSATSGLCTACIVAASLETFIDVLCDLGIGSDSCEPFWEDLKVDDSACDDL